MKWENANVRVLLVDDDAAVRSGLAKALRLSGFQVSECGDGEGACAALREAYYDVAILDLVMPRLNGWETLEVLTREAPGTRVLLFTGEAGQQDFADAAGASALVEKPVDIEELCDLIEFFAREGLGERLERLAGMRDLRVMRA